MMIEQKLAQLLQGLSDKNSAKIRVGDSRINIRVFDVASKLSLQTPVYQGGNYIPKSVRFSVSKNGIDIRTQVKTFLTIDEEGYIVNLNYVGQANLSRLEFKELLEEFSEIANEWRLILDEQDRNDLIYVPVR